MNYYISLYMNYCILNSIKKINQYKNEITLYSFEYAAIVWIGRDRDDMIAVARKEPLEGPLSYNSNHILQNYSFSFLLHLLKLHFSDEHMITSSNIHVHFFFLSLFSPIIHNFNEE